MLFLFSLYKYKMFGVEVKDGIELITEDLYIVGHEAEEVKFSFEVLDHDMIMPIPEGWYRPENFAYVEALGDKQIPAIAMNVPSHQIGHMPASANYHFSKPAFESVFNNACVVPMHSTVNDSTCAALEDLSRKIATKASIVVVLTGPIYKKP